MGFRKAAFVCALLLCAVSGVHAGNLLVEEAEITEEERRLFATIARFDKSFRYSTRAKRYYAIHPETKTKLPILVELVFSKVDGLYFGEFVSYAVSVRPHSSVVTYAFDAGTADRGEGTFMVTPRGVIQVRRGCGVSACRVQIVENGRVLYEGP